MGRNPEEVTDEAPRSRSSAPDHPLFQWPNRITEKDFTGWVRSAAPSGCSPGTRIRGAARDPRRRPGTPKGRPPLCPVRKRRLHLQRLGLLPAAPRRRPRGVPYLCEPVEPSEESRPLSYGAGPVEILCPGDSASGARPGSMTLMRAIPTRLAVLLSAALAFTACSRRDPSHTIAATREEAPDRRRRQGDHGGPLARDRADRRVQALPGSRRDGESRRLYQGDQGRCRRPRRQGQLLATLEVPEMGDDLRKAERASCAPRPRSPAPATNSGAPNPRTRSPTFPSSASPSVNTRKPGLIAAAGDRRRPQQGPGHRGAGRRREIRPGRRRGAGQACNTRRHAEGQDPHRLHPSHRALRRRHHQALRRHRLHDPGRHRFADPGHARGAALPEQHAAPDPARSRIRRAHRSHRAAGRGAGADAQPLVPRPRRPLHRQDLIRHPHHGHRGRRAEPQPAS